MPIDIAANRASSNFDLRHNLSISYVYGLPFFKGTGLTHSLLGGWQVSGITVAQSGLPFTVTNGTNFGDNAGVANGVGTGRARTLSAIPTRSRPTRKPPAPPFLALCTTTRPHSRCPTGLTFGNVGRNTLYLPGRLNFDFGLFKQFPIREKMGFQFRWEMFNVFNHTQFDAVSGNSVIHIARRNQCCHGFRQPGLGQQVWPVPASCI